jgi:hypothetical protein
MSIGLRQYLDRKSGNLAVRGTIMLGDYASGIGRPACDFDLRSRSHDHRHVCLFHNRSPLM